MANMVSLTCILQTAPGMAHTIQINTPYLPKQEESPPKSVNLATNKKKCRAKLCTASERSSRSGSLRCEPDTYLFNSTRF